MAAIDYEAEYNNRARVPEHPQIFARWTYEAELYRAEMLKAGRAELGLTYGSTPRQTIDLFLAQGHENAPHVRIPLATVRPAHDGLWSFGRRSPRRRAPGN